MSRSASSSPLERHMELISAAAVLTFGTIACVVFGFIRVEVESGRTKIQIGRKQGPRGCLSAAAHTSRGNRVAASLQVEGQASQSTLNNRS